MRILIVEDHSDTADLMARLLRARGHEVQIAQTVADALSATTDGQPAFQLLLSDILLPDASGMDLMRKTGIKHGIAISGTAEDAARAKAAGFDDHMLKPVQFDQLMDRIAEMES